MHYSTETWKGQEIDSSEATLHSVCYALPAGAVRNPGTVTDSSASSGERVMWL